MGESRFDVNTSRSMSLQKLPAAMFFFSPEFFPGQPAKARRIAKRGRNQSTFRNAFTPDTAPADRSGFNSLVMRFSLVPGLLGSFRGRALMQRISLALCQTDRSMA